VLFGVVVVGSLWIMDRAAYGRAERLYGRVERVARSGESEPGFEVAHEGHVVVVSVAGVQADLCNAFTGGLWFGFVMPRSESVRKFHPDVRSRSGFCDRSGTNTLLFRFPEGQGPDGAGRAPQPGPKGADSGVGGPGLTSLSGGGRAG